MNDVGDILDTLGDKWDSLTEVEQNALATAIAGTKQRENFIVLMENYETAVDYANEALNSSGTAMEKYDAYLQSVEASQAKLKATFEEFSQALVDKGIIRSFYDMAAAGVQLLTNMTKLIPLLKIIMVILSGMLSGKVIVKLLDSMRSGSDLLSRLSKVLKENISNLKLYRTSLKSSEDATIDQAQATKIAKGELLAYQIAATAVIAVITLVISAYQYYKQTIEENIENAKDHIKTIQEEQESLENLKQQYIDLAKSENHSDETRNNIASVQQQIVDLVGEEVEGLDLVNGELDEQLEKLDDISFKKAEENLDTLKGELETLQQGLGEKLFDPTEAYDFLFIKGDAAALQDAINKAIENEKLDAKILQDANFSLTAIPGALGGTTHMQIEDAEDLLEIYKKIRTAIQETTDAEGNYDIQAWNAANKVVTELEGRIKAYETALNSVEQAEATVELGKFLSENTVESADALKDFIKSLDEAGYSEETVAKMTEILIRKFPEFEKELKDTDNNINQYARSLEDIEKNIEGAKNAYDSMTSALDEYNNSGSISYDTYMSLLDLGDEYLQLLFDENGALVDNRVAIENVMRAELQQYAIKKALTYLENVRVNGITELTSALGEEAEATSILTQAQLVQAQIALSQIKNADERMAAAQQFVAIVNSVNNVTFGSTKATNSNSDAKDEARKIQDQYNSTIKYATTVLDEEIEKLEEEKEAIEERNKALQEELDIYDKALAYINKYISGKIDALEKEKQALQEKNDEQEREIELEELRNNINKNHQRTMRTYSEDQGWTWVVNPEDIKETEDAIKEYNKKVADYEKEDEIAKIEEQIEAWKEYLAMWEEIPSVYEEMEAKIAFESLSAYVTEEDLLNKRTNVVGNFKNSYVRIQKEISKNSTEEIDKQIKKLQDIKKQWESIPSDYETASNKLNAEMLLGKDAREKILSGEAGAIQSFAEAYGIAMKNAEDAAKKGASGISSALGSIKLPELTVEELMAYATLKPDEGKTTQTFTVKPGEFIVGKDSGEKYIEYNDKYLKVSDASDKSFTFKGGFAHKYTFDEGTYIYSQPYASGTKSAKAGLANVDEKGEELIVPKQGRYRMMEYGDAVVPHNLSQRLFDVATNPLKFMANAINSIKSPILNEFGGNNNTTTISIGNITMPQSINNADKFVKELQLIAANR